MDLHWLYLNEETSRLHEDNKWFRLLQLIPKSVIKFESNTMDRIRFALINQEFIEHKAKKDIFRFILSNAIGDWDARKESNHMQVFDCPEIFKQTKVVKKTTMLAIQGLVKKHNPDAYKEWDAHFKRIQVNGYRKAVRANSKKETFLNSSLYKFIMQLTEQDYRLVTADALYKQYTEYCQKHNIVTITKRAVGLALNSHGIQTYKRKLGRSYDINADCIHTFIHYYDDETELTQLTVAPTTTTLVESSVVPPSIPAKASTIDMNGYSSDEYSDDNDDEPICSKQTTNANNSTSEYSYDSTRNVDNDEDEVFSRCDGSECYDSDDSFFKPVKYYKPPEESKPLSHFNDEYIEPQIKLTPDQLLEIRNEFIQMRLDASNNESNNNDEDDEVEDENEQEYGREYEQGYDNEDESYE